MKKLFVSDCIKLAINETNMKLRNNLLLKDSDVSYSSANGDSVSIYSIASMYANFVEEVKFIEAYERILDALITRFPEYE